MNPLRFALIDYRIARVRGGSLNVRGYAVDLSPPLEWLHICVRMWSRNDWTVDHYETGLSIEGPLLYAIGVYTARELAFARRYRFDRRTRATVTRSAIKWLLYLHGRGTLRERIERAIGGEFDCERAYGDETLVATR